MQDSFYQQRILNWQAEIMKKHPEIKVKNVETHLYSI